MVTNYKLNYKTDWSKHFNQKQKIVCQNNHTLVISCVPSVHLNVHNFVPDTQD